MTQQKKEFKRRIFDIIQVGSKTDLPSYIFDYFIVVVIFCNIAVIFLETFDSMKQYSGLFAQVELITTIIFTVEYILRVWTAEYLFPGKSRLWSKALFCVSFFGVIDLLSILPFYLPVIFPTGIVAFRIFRVIRIFRLFRINAKYDAFNIIADVIKERSDQLISSLVIIFMLMLASSLIMYNLEHEAQPELYTDAFSGIWWSVSALLTVGYGDIYPITLGGRIMAIIISFLGVGLVSIPTGIMSAGFVQKYTEMQEVSEKNLDEENSSCIYVTAYKGHSWTGKTINQIEMPPGLHIEAIRREGKVILPAKTEIIRDGDVCLLHTQGK